MTLKEFSESLEKFYQQDGIDKDIVSLDTLLNNVLSYFFTEYDKVDDAEFVTVHYKSHLKAGTRKAVLRADLETKLNEANDLIKGACAYGSLEGKTKFYNFFFKNDGSLVNDNYASSIAKGKCFFRMRGSESYHVYNRMGLFQIPNNIIKLVGKQRFNQDGVPCLYLGESLYCAWEEVRRKNFEQVNFAGFKNMKKLAVLDFTIKPRLQKKEDFILAYFSLLVSGKVVDEESHKFQYDVSNLTMDILLASVAKDGNVDGIKYMSSRRYDGVELSIEDKSRMIGYVFPPKRELIAETGIDKWMRDCFKLTEPRTSFMYDIHLIDFDRTKTAITSDYQNTLFYMIEESLKKEDFAYCDK